MTKLLNILALLAFLLSAIVQFNDPDPLLWILLYVAAGFTCGLYWKRWPTRHAAAFTSVASVVWIIFLAVKLSRSPFPIEWESVLMQTSMKNISVELAREIGGLLIVTLWMTYLFLRARR